MDEMCGRNLCGGGSLAAIFFLYLMWNVVTGWWGERKKKAEAPALEAMRRQEQVKQRQVELLASMKEASGFLQSAYPNFWAALMQQTEAKQALRIEEVVSLLKEQNVLKQMLKNLQNYGDDVPGVADIKRQMAEHYEQMVRPL